MIFFVLVNFVLAPVFAQTPSTAQTETPPEVKISSIDVRAMAREELNKSPEETTKSKKEIRKKTNPKETQKDLQEPGSAPSIMLPLHDPYKPVSLRSWQWSLDVGMSAQKILVTKPAFVLGRDDLSDLGTLPFLNVSFGFEKDQAWGSWGASLIAATTTKSENVSGSTGYPIKANLQWVSYGIEPHVSKKWNSWLGTTAGLQYELVSVAQTSNQSDFARWSQNFSSTNIRLGLDGYVNQNQAVTISLIQKTSDYGRTLAWALTYGVKW